MLTPCTSVAFDGSGEGPKYWASMGVCVWGSALHLCSLNRIVHKNQLLPWLSRTSQGGFDVESLEEGPSVVPGDPGLCPHFKNSCSKCGVWGCPWASSICIGKLLNLHIV